MDEQTMAALTALLLKLSELEAQRPCSLARLAKQAGRPMSTLLREVTALEAMGLVVRDGEAATVRLSAQGRFACAALAGVVPGAV
jgi:DNA-binding IclR family transcriptional regulator